MAVSFKQICKDMYNWQCGFYRHTPIKVISPIYDFSDSDCESDDEEIRRKYTDHKYFNSMASTDKYVVIKWFHPQMEDLWIISFKDDENFIKCTEGHISVVLDIIDKYDTKGMTYDEIQDSIIPYPLGIKTEVKLNLKAILNHLLALGIISSANQFKRKIMYKLNLSSYNIEEFSDLSCQCDMLTNLPEGLNTEILDDFLYMSYRYGIEGFSEDAMALDLDQVSIYKVIKEDLPIIIEYGVKQGFIVKI